MIYRVNRHFITELRVDALEQRVLGVLVRDEEGQSYLAAIRVLAPVEGARYEAFVILLAHGIVKAEEDHLGCVGAV